MCFDRYDIISYLTLSHISNTKNNWYYSTKDDHHMYLYRYEALSYIPNTQSYLKQHNHTVLPN